MIIQLGEPHYPLYIPIAGRFILSFVATLLLAEQLNHVPETRKTR